MKLARVKRGFLRKLKPQARVIRKAYDQGYSMGELCKMLGVGRTVVHYELHKDPKFKARSLSEAMELRYSK